MTDAPDYDPLYREIVLRAFKGLPTIQPVDEHYPTKGPPQERYRDGSGDRQALLCEALLAGLEGRKLPPWAIAALEKIMFKIADADLVSWEVAFGPLVSRRTTKKGKVESGAYKKSIQKLRTKTIPAWRRVRELNARHKKRGDGFGIGHHLYNQVALDLGLSEREVKDSYEQVQAFVTKHCREYLK
jgi:hypothetical protein